MNPVIFLVVLLGGIAVADAGPLPTETVIVSASRSAAIRLPSAADIQVIDRDAIEASGARSLAELLRGRAGIHISDPFGDGSNASIDMRGFGGTAISNTLLLIDGRKLNPGSDAASLYLGAVDLDAVEQVEIIQGSAGILFGSQAVGGVVNLITRRPHRAEFELGAGGGSFNGLSLRGRVAERLPSGIGYRIQMTHRHGDNYRRRNAFDADNLSALLDWQRDNTRLFIEHAYLDEMVETPGALFLEEAAADPRQAPFNGDFLDTRSQVTRAGLRLPLGQYWQLEGELAYRDDNRDFVQSFRTFPGSSSNQAREVVDLNPRLTGRVPGPHGETVITVGTDVQSTDYRLTTAFGPQQVDQRIAAVYGQVQWPFADDWRLIAGARHARVENDIPTSQAMLDDDVTIGSVGLIYTPDAAWEFRVRADQNYRFAKVDEHTNVVFGQPVGLENQRGLTLEAGATWRKAAHRVSLLAYRLDLDDEINFDASGFVNINLDQTRRNGVQLTAESALTGTLIAGASYDWVDSEITAGPNSGNRIPLVPEHRGRVYLNWRPQPGLSGALEWLIVDEQVYGSDFANRFPVLPGYDVLNLSASLERHGLRFGVRINNLLDETYAETGNIGSDALGSGHAQCIGGFFSDSCPAINPSPERNLWFSVAATFGP